jgi:two-component system, cell cycle sensor histidine kinase and response regulator CckA
VTDTGHGMDEPTKARVFEPFFTTKEVGKGTGLGLAMVHGVVAQSGGRISFDSEVGHGTTFRILLPRVPAEAVRAPREAPEPALPKAIGRILIVEDDVTVREMTRLALERSGYSVTQVGNAEDAITELDRPAAAFDLVISDVVMPGAGAAVLIEGIRARDHAVPVIFVSGYPRDSPVVKGIAGSEYPFLAKPFTPSRLLSLVGSTLADRAGSPRVASSHATRVPGHGSEQAAA